MTELSVFGATLDAYCVAVLRDGESCAVEGCSARSMIFFSREPLPALEGLASASCRRTRSRSDGTLVSCFHAPRACTMRSCPRAAMRSQMLDAYQRTTSVGAIQTQRAGSTASLRLIVFIVDAKA